MDESDCPVRYVVTRIGGSTVVTNGNDMVGSSDILAAALSVVDVVDGPLLPLLSSLSVNGSSNVNAVSVS